MRGAPPPSAFIWGRTECSRVPLRAAIRRHLKRWLGRSAMSSCGPDPVYRLESVSSFRGLWVAVVRPREGFRYVTSLMRQRPLVAEYRRLPSPTCDVWPWAIRVKRPCSFVLSGWLCRRPSFVRLARIVRPACTREMWIRAESTRNVGERPKDVIQLTDRAGALPIPLLWSATATRVGSSS